MSGFLPNPNGGGGGESTPPADATTQGKLKLAGDLSGTADLPTVVDLTITGESTGSLLTFNGAKWSAFPSGSMNTVLVSAGENTTPVWYPFPTGMPPVGSAGGDLSGTYPNPTVKDLTISGEQNYSILYFNENKWNALDVGSSNQFLSCSNVDGIPSIEWRSLPSSEIYIDGQESGSMLYFDGTNWSCVATTTERSKFLSILSGVPTWLSVPYPPIADDEFNGLIVMSGDLSGTGNDPIVSRINQITVDTSTPSAGGIMQYDGSKIVYAPVSLAGGTSVSGTLSVNNLPAASTGARGIVRLTNDLGGTANVPTVVNMTLPDQAAGSTLYYTGSQWTALTTSTAGSKLTVGSSGNPVWGPPDGLVIKKSVSISLSAGNQDTTIYTVPSGSSLIISSIFVKLTALITGAGSVAITVGTTTGGNELTVSKSVDSSSLIGVISGLSVDSLGSTLVPNNGYMAELPATTNIYARCKTTGTITAGGITVYIYGTVLQ